MKRKIAEKMNQMKKNKKGFTLIELIVVIAIIGVLAALLVPSMMGYVQQAKDSKGKANARTAYTAAQAAYTDLASTKKYGEEGFGDTDIATKAKALMGNTNEAITVTADETGILTVTIDGWTYDASTGEATTTTP